MNKGLKSSSKENNTIMVAAPRHVYSAVIKNQTNHDLTVKATYELPKDEGVDHFEVLLPAQGLIAIPQRLVEDGSCTLTGHIVNLSVTGESLSVELKGPYNVQSPTKDHPFVICATETGLLISEGASPSE